ncbi:MAG: hypothetical protein HDS30_06085 [Bacteroides sp.]|nr:hypothetical protein [Bacteroides sp.]MDE6042757.1 hypothetical protein [Muribaculaceae bacterium]
MKRILIVAIVLFVSCVCRAAVPDLACLKIFDKKELRTEGHELTIVTQPGNYFRSVSFSNDPKLEKEIEAAVEQDRRHAVNCTEHWDGKTHYTILNIGKGNYIISVGFYKEADGSVRLFVQGEPEAFK